MACDLAGLRHSGFTRAGNTASAGEQPPLGLAGESLGEGRPPRRGGRGSRLPAGRVDIAA